MGMPFDLVFYAESETAAITASDAAFARIAELNACLSDYDPESELSRLSATAGRGESVPVSDDLWRVLVRAGRMARASEGAFDITVGPLVRLWRRARREKELPSVERLRAARAAVGYEKLELDEERQTARLTAEGMRLDLGGIAVGYAADEALAVLARHGIHRAMVDGSGDIVLGDPPPGKTGWTIGIAPLEAPDGPPSRYVRLSRASISTSGDAWQHVEIDGVRYSHIVDPNTGLGLTESSSVTVIAADGITADCLATAVSVLGPQRGLALVEATEGAHALIVRQGETGIETTLSPRFASFEVDADAEEDEAGGHQRDP